MEGPLEKRSTSRSRLNKSKNSQSLPEKKPLTTEEFARLQQDKPGDVYANRGKYEDKDLAKGDGKSDPSSRSINGVRYRVWRNSKVFIAYDWVTNPVCSPILGR